jgi:hypothetical protein
MPETPLRRRTLNTLTSFRTSILSTIGHLRGIENNATRSRSRSDVTFSRSTVETRGQDTQVCEGCHSVGHHYTECLNHQYVWDSEANARLLQPGERLSGPADWQDIHRASLHHLIRTAVQYYISLHHTRVQDLHILLSELETNSPFGDISCFAQHGQSGEASSSSASSSEPPQAPTPIYPPLSSPGPPNQFLINLAVLAASTRLRVDPWNGTTGYIQFIALHHWHPSFGVEFPLFLRLVLAELQEPRLPDDFPVATL